jgi:putative GTP pyrophosphokinase
MKAIEPKYSKKKVAKAGEILRKGSLITKDMIWANEVLSNWRAVHSFPINTFQATLRNKLKKDFKWSLVAQRLKRKDSIIRKLKRYPGMSLARMQDIGGLRAVVSSVVNVEELQWNYKNTRFEHELINEKDYIKEPKSTGYRGVHLVYRYKNPRAMGIYDGLMLELQIRSSLQHAWATAVETMGIFLDQSLKTSEGSTEWLDFFSLMSSGFAHIERTSPVPGFEHLNSKQTADAIIEKERQLDVISKLSGFTVAAQSITTGESRGSYHLIILNQRSKSVEIQSFSEKRFIEATEKYSDFENQDDDNLNIVLVKTGSVNKLKQAYPNYFLDTTSFMYYLTSILQGKYLS